MASQAERGEIPKLGSTVEFGALLLRLVELDGWTVIRRPRVGGGVLVEACHGDLRVARDGDQLADVALPVFMEAMRLRGRYVR